MDFDTFKGLSMITFALLIGSMGMIYAYVYISMFITHLVGHSLIVNCLLPVVLIILELYLSRGLILKKHSKKDE